MKKWGKGKVKRAISGGAGLLFKGSGFYITDYRSENYKAAAKKDSAGGGESSGSAKTDSATSSTTSATPSTSASSPASTPKKTESKPAKPAAPKS